MIFFLNGLKPSTSIIFLIDIILRGEKGFSRMFELLWVFLLPASLRTLLQPFDTPILRRKDRCKCNLRKHDGFSWSKTTFAGAYIEMLEHIVTSEWIVHLKTKCPHCSKPRALDQKIPNRIFPIGCRWIYGQSLALFFFLGGGYQKCIFSPLAWTKKTYIYHFRKKKHLPTLCALQLREVLSIST